ncbi:PREDICTED: beta-glucuronidase [Nicrophorus vespilloides]|uniref:Beta-glucuronidase n=1 Tax=Nicrophorus vespilloides TaxID=110193 RepID=A0ABM1MEY9_NICVS|nr:PREDICTED: beta-glucuronidase [Nicrophorus vespilloides]XP_017773139.1 PREDICTED: beta-glucuronidase [Nicrophorus vespilloides]
MEFRLSWMLTEFCFLVCCISFAKCGILYPQESETREVKSLDGLWNFAVSSYYNKLIGFSEHWYKKDISKLEHIESMLMPVPSSYNDITQNADIRDHVGLVWYQRAFFVPKSWMYQGVWLRFGSVSYAAQVWINGNYTMNHEIGHLPFEKEISRFIKFGEENYVTVACDNTLLPDTIPQGSLREVQTENGKKLMQSYSFDFFNYAGIHRPVTLYAKPHSFISDITVITDVDDDEETGIVNYNISYASNIDLLVNVTLLDASGNTVASDDGLGYNEGALYVRFAKLWWPYLMHPEPGYLYTLLVQLLTPQGELKDVYRQKIGIRKITWTNTSLLMNGKPLYLQGFGKHEDADIRGKGLDLPTIMKDYNLIKWIGGNAFRTSHYPYAEEIMDLADKFGIMVIDECPSVDTELFSLSLLEKHKKSLTELIKRDKNRPSVIAWSIANEPRTQSEQAGIYFGEVANHTRNLDSTRPITLAVARGVYEDKSGEHLDFISFNRYNAWYSNGGQLDMIQNYVISEASAWHEKYNKPVLMSEYGGDTMPGLHIHPAYIWSEEYQVQLLSKHFQAFDHLRRQEWFIGEFIWNFADFKTAQTYTRVGGNRKGLFTRTRQPKTAAFHVRKRYMHLANQMYNSTLPEDLYDYVAPSTYHHDEL